MKNSFFCLLLAFTMQGNAQDEYKHRYLGIGFKLGAFQTSDLDLNYPVNRFYLNVDPIRYVRIDAQFGIRNSTRQQVQSTWPSGSQTFDLHDKNAVWSLGAFGQYWFDDMSLYLGGRYGQMTYSNEDLEYDSFTGAYYVGKDKGVVNQWAVVTGGEYRFGKRFSVGAELSILMMSETFDSSTSTTNIERKFTVFETSAFFRFYPF